MDRKYYAGIGSRQTPQNIIPVMTLCASHLEKMGYTLRSGGADGADTAFENGVLDEKNKQIFLPWRGFNRRAAGTFSSFEFPAEAAELAESFHPNWEACSRGARAMHTRNVLQVLGPDLKTPSDFILCWTKDGKGAGGTGQAIRIAQAHNIPIFDLGLGRGGTVLTQFVKYLQTRHRGF